MGRREFVFHLCLDHCLCMPLFDPRYMTAGVTTVLKAVQFLSHAVVITRVHQNKKTADVIKLEQPSEHREKRPKINFDL